LTSVCFELSPVPPFRLDLTVWVLRRRPHNEVDRWDGRVYRRVLVPQGGPLEVALTQTGAAGAAPRLRVEVRGVNAPGPETISYVRATLTRMLGLDVNLTGFYRLARSDPRLHALVGQFGGVKPPRFPDLFEALVNAVACQQLSLTAGIHLLNRLAAAWGPTFPEENGLRPAFPRPGDLAGADLEALRTLGFSRNKGRALLELARGVREGRMDLKRMETLNEEAAVKYLKTWRGIGRWSAEYVLLRGLGRWQVFPGDDVGARHRLQAWLKQPEPLDYQGVRRVLARWHPFGGLIYFHFLLSHLAAEGHLTP
jgi:DNA-3-methyladenine glycosylase II